MKTILTILLLLLNCVLRAQTSTKVVTSNDTLQYAAGAYVGTWLQQNNIKISNYDLFKKAIADIATGKPAVKDSLLNLSLARQIQTAQLQNAKAQEQALFQMIKQQKGVGVLPSGLCYLPDSTGSGMRPGVKDSVELDLRGALPNGQLFADTYGAGKTLKMNLVNFIPGLYEGIQLMPEGSKWRFFIPASLAYGATGNGNSIPPNSALIFLVELKKVVARK